MDIVVLLPKGRCSTIQEKQMTTAIEENVHVYRGTCVMDFFLLIVPRRYFSCGSNPALCFGVEFVLFAHYVSFHIFI